MHVNWRTNKHQNQELRNRQQDLINEMNGVNYDYHTADDRDTDRHNPNINHNGRLESMENYEEY